MTSGSVTFPVGTTTQLVTINAPLDGLDENSESMRLKLLSDSHGTISRSLATGTIVDGDAPPNVSVASVTAGANATQANLTIQLSTASGKDVSVTYQTTADTGASHPAVAGYDYTAKTGTVVIPAGQTAASISVGIAHDHAIPNAATFAVALSQADGATVTGGNAVVTIPQYFPPRWVSISSTRGAVAGQQAGAFVITSTGQSSGPVTVHYRISDRDSTAEAGTDYVALAGTTTGSPLAGTITLADGQTRAEIPVTAIAHANDLATKTLRIYLVDDGSYDLGDGTSATLAIRQVADSSLPSVTLGRVANQTTQIVLPENTGGTWHVVLGSHSTSAIDAAATAAAVQSAIEALPGIGTGKVQVTGAGTDATPFTIELVGALAGTAGAAVGTFSLDVSSLTGAMAAQGGVTTHTLRTPLWRARLMIPEAEQHLKYIDQMVLLTTVKVQHTDGTEKIYVLRHYPAGDSPFEPTHLSAGFKLGAFGPGGYKGALAGLTDWAYGVPQRMWYWATALPKIQLVAGPFDASIGHEGAAKKVFDVYMDAAEKKAVLLAKAIPIVGTALHFKDGEWFDGTISLLGDAALLAGPLAKGLSIAKYANAADKVRKAAVGIELTIAGVRGVQGLIAAGDDPVKAAAYIGEALLRVYGAKLLAKTRVSPIDELPFGKDLPVGTYTTRIEWGIHNVDARRYGPGYWGKRIPQADKAVDAFELRINPNNESYYLPHPKGGFVQFENLVGHNLQDGKLITQVKSFYHVEDLPPFSKKGVLDEARRQLEAAAPHGLRVEWIVTDQRAREQLIRLFKAEGIAIEVVPVIK